MARGLKQSPTADPHERAENRLIRKMASLHKEKVVMARKPHESKAEHARAGRKGGHAESKAEHAKAGRAAHHKGTKHEGGHGAEHKMAEVHVHHHHHHHTGGHKAK